MKRPNPKVSFHPGFFVWKRILTLAVFCCILVFFSLVYASGPGRYDASVGEHPWDECSQNQQQPPKPPGISSVIMFPSASFDKWIIIGFPQVKNEDNKKSQVQNHSSDKNWGRFFMFF
jgi:hypothetical protein